jgi:ribosomal RNA-processing protein 12
MVLGGLVGTSPHMISASVMALARLLHQFATELGGVAPTLLPAVLMLLRTKSREVVKSVLGFVKVRSPVLLAMAQCGVCCTVMALLPQGL